MIIMGVDYHPGDQYIAFVDTETGEGDERRLKHSDGETERFYRELAAREVSVRVGMEATGYSGWFEPGTARYRTWRKVERRAHEWASRSFARGSSN